MKLRFLPAVRAGEGSAMASWQEIAWKWGREHFAAGAPTPGPAPAAPAVGGAEVRVCADVSGKLTRDPVITRSSGDPALDQAALRIARSGAPWYRPAGATPVTGCAQLAIKFETQ
jgi:TonB family protein